MNLDLLSSGVKCSFNFAYTSSNDTQSPSPGRVCNIERIEFWTICCAMTLKMFLYSNVEQKNLPNSRCLFQRNQLTGRYISKIPREAMGDPNAAIIFYFFGFYFFQTTSSVAANIECANEINTNYNISKTLLSTSSFSTLKQCYGPAK